MNLTKRHHISRDFSQPFTIKETEFSKILIREINKPSFRNTFLIESSKYKHSLNLSSLDITKSKKNIKQITHILLQFPLFSFFINYNNIEEDILCYIANNFIHTSIPKGNFIYKQGTPSKKFYVLIKGTISLFRTSSSFTEEIGVYSKGFCFGDKDIAFQKPYSSSALALEDCELFYLFDDVFNTSLQKYVYKKEVEIRTLLKKTLAPKDDMGIAFFESLHNEMKELHFFDRTKKFVLFKEGEIAEKIYIIIASMFGVYKNGLKVIEMGKGGILGIESIFGVEKYIYSVTGNNDDSVLIELNVKKLDENVVKKLRKFLRENYEQFMKIFNEFLTSKVKVVKYEKMKFRININKNIKVDFNARMRKEVKEKMREMNERKGSILKYKIKKMTNIKTSLIKKNVIQLTKINRSSNNNYNNNNAHFKRISHYKSFSLSLANQNTTSKLDVNLTEKKKKNSHNSSNISKQYLHTEEDNYNALPRIKKSSTHLKTRMKNKSRIILSESLREIIANHTTANGLNLIDSGTFNIPLISSIKKTEI